MTSCRLHGVSLDLRCAVPRSISPTRYPRQVEKATMAWALLLEAFRFHPRAAEPSRTFLAFFLLARLDRPRRGEGRCFSLHAAIGLGLYCKTDPENVSTQFARSPGS